MVFQEVLRTYINGQLVFFRDKDKTFHLDQTSFFPLCTFRPTPQKKAALRSNQEDWTQRRMARKTTDQEDATGDANITTIIWEQSIHNSLLQSLLQWARVEGEPPQHQNQHWT